jgi:hypothetical protein
VKHHAHDTFADLRATIFAPSFQAKIDRLQEGLRAISVDERRR